MIAVLSSFLKANAVPGAADARKSHISRVLSKISTLAGLSFETGVCELA
jgi:hypothetical protein